jgi:hypothetical protein
MRRRSILLASALPLAARAHHGWSSFDLSRPIYLEGRASKVAWRNPHVELELELATGMKLPADLATRAVPQQAAAVDGPGLLKAAQLPMRGDKRWTIELAPLPRMEAWQVPEIKSGDSMSVLHLCRRKGRRGAAGGVPVCRWQDLRSALLTGLMLLAVQ